MGTVQVCTGCLQIPLVQIDYSSMKMDQILYRDTQNAEQHCYRLTFWKRSLKTNKRDIHWKEKYAKRTLKLWLTYHADINRKKQWNHPFNISLQGQAFDNKMADLKYVNVPPVTRKMPKCNAHSPLLALPKMHSAHGLSKFASASGALNPQCELTVFVGQASDGYTGRNPLPSVWYRWRCLAKTLIPWLEGF